MFKDRKIPYLNLIPILFIAFIMYRVVNNFELLSDAVRFMLSLLSYFIWGFAIAYVLNPLMVYLEKNFKFKRQISMLCIYLFFIGLLTFVFVFIGPKILTNLWELVENIPRFANEADEWLHDFIDGLDFIEENNIMPFVESNVDVILMQVNEFVSAFVSTVLKHAINLTSGIMKLVFGIIISIYLLKDKESFAENIKRLIQALFNQNQAVAIIQFGQETNVIFSRYIIGKTIDSIIIGILCFIGLLILGVPYSLLIGLIVGITNMIPYFGPFIGMVPATIITLFHSPILALWVFIFILLLQQFDGWILGPKILGEHVGLTPFWIIVAILIGGGAFGVMGMLLGVPTMAVLKNLVDRFIEKKTREKEKVFSNLNI